VLLNVEHACFSPQVFLDIVEQVNVLMNSKGSVLRCDVNGKMIMKAFLSGMPEVKIGLNDRLDVRALNPPLPRACKAHPRARCGHLRSHPAEAAFATLSQPESSLMVTPRHCGCHRPGSLQRAAQ